MEKEDLHATRHSVLEGFRTDELETSLEANIRRTQKLKQDLMHQKVAVEDDAELHHAIQQEETSINKMLEEEQKHKLQVQALKQMQDEMLKVAEHQLDSCRKQRRS